jgi:hypothetical protein
VLLIFSFGGTVGSIGEQPVLGRQYPAGGDVDQRLQPPLAVVHDGVVAVGVSDHGCRGSVGT